MLYFDGTLGGLLSSSAKLILADVDDQCHTIVMISELGSNTNLRSLTEDGERALITTNKPKKTIDIWLLELPDFEQ